jgi:hypothetical protein
MPLTSKSRVLTNLATWFEAQCDGNWEHHYGVVLESLDNPGWRLTVDLKSEHPDVLLISEGEPPGPQTGNVGGRSWLVCEVRQNRFLAAGDPTRLEELVRRFNMFIESSE